VGEREGRREKGRIIQVGSMMCIMNQELGLILVL
jgi:hypothetical protein